MFAPFWEFLFQHPYIASATSILTLSAIMKYMFKPLSRVKRLSPTAERVLIVGATSGVGRNLANLYAKRGTKVCIIGRRQAQLEEVRAECIQSGDAANIKSSILAMAADMTSAEDLVAVREYLEKEWGGVDTIVVCAGVSALRPLLDVAHSPHGKSETSVEAVKLTGEVAQKAISGNFTGPLLTAVTFVCLIFCLVATTHAAFRFPSFNGRHRRLLSFSSRLWRHSFLRQAARCIVRAKLHL